MADTRTYCMSRNSYCRKYVLQTEQEAMSNWPHSMSGLWTLYLWYFLTCRCFHFYFLCRWLRRNYIILEQQFISNTHEIRLAHQVLGHFEPNTYNCSIHTHTPGGRHPFFFFTGIKRPKFMYWVSDDRWQTTLYGLVLSTY